MYLIFSCNSERLLSAMLRIKEWIKEWIKEGEVSGTDHYIGMEYDPEEYKDLLIIASLLDVTYKNQIIKETKEKLYKEVKK